MSKNLPLHVDNVSKSFGKHTVLDNVSIEVQPGEIFGLIGLNGAGKTTLIKIILGLLSQDSGNVTLSGKNVDDPKTRENLSFLPEKFQPSILLKGTEFLSLTLSYYGKKYDHEAARAAAAGLDLNPDVLDSKMTKYSKGMGQKIGIVSAFLTDTPLLILDEPMSGLDPSARIYLKDSLLEYVKQKGKTIFFSSHILSDIDEICDRVAVLHDSKMVFVGSPKDFKKKFKKNNLERAFLEAIKSDKKKKAA